MSTRPSVSSKSCCWSLVEDIAASSIVKPSSTRSSTISPVLFLRRMLSVRMAVPTISGFCITSFAATIIPILCSNVLLAAARAADERNRASEIPRDEIAKLLPQKLLLSPHLLYMATDHIKTPISVWCGGMAFLPYSCVYLAYTQVRTGSSSQFNGRIAKPSMLPCKVLQSLRIKDISHCFHYVFIGCCPGYANKIDSILFAVFRFYVITPL